MTNLIKLSVMNIFNMFFEGDIQLNFKLTFRRAHLIFQTSTNLAQEIVFNMKNGIEHLGS